MELVGAPRAAHEIVPASNLNEAAQATSTDVVVQSFAHLPSNPSEEDKPAEPPSKAERVSVRERAATFTQKLSETDPSPPPPQPLPVRNSVAVKALAMQISSRDDSHASNRAASPPPRPQASSSSTFVKNYASQFSRSGTNDATAQAPSTTATTKSPKAARGGGYMGSLYGGYMGAKQIFTASPSTAAPPLQSSKAGSGSQKRFPTVQPAGGIINGVVYSHAGSKVARPISSGAGGASSSSSSSSSCMPSAAQTPEDASAAPMAAMAPAATMASGVASGHGEESGGGSGDGGDEGTSEANAAAAVDQLALSWAPTAAPSGYGGGNLPAPLVGRPQLASAYATADSHAQRLRHASPLDELLKAPGEMWQAFDQSFFGVLWPDRPWAPIPGGTSHLKYRPKPPAPLSPRQAFAGTRWDVRGLRWKRIDEIPLEDTHDLPPPAAAPPTEACGGGGPATAASSSFSSSSSSPSNRGAVARRSRAANASGERARSDGKFALHPELLAAFNDPGAACALKVRILDEAFTLVETLAGSRDDLAANFFRMRARFLEGTPETHNACYVLFRGDERSWALFSFVSDHAPVREKMMYSWGRRTLVAGLGGNERIPWHDHWASLSEVILPDPSDGDEATGAGREADEFAALTEVERQLLQGERDALAEAARHTEEARAKGVKLKASTGLTFPLANDALAAIESFKAGTLGALIVSISGEQIVLRSAVPSHHAAVVASALRASVPDECCYVLYRWVHERSGTQGAPPASAASDLLLFLRPEDAPMRSKMLHASALRPLEAALTQEHGVAVTKSIENLEPHELTDAGLYKEVYVYGQEEQPSSSSSAADAAALLPPAVDGGVDTAAAGKAARLQRMKSNRSAARGGLHA